MSIKAKFDLAESWGTTEAERTLHFGCDDALPTANGFYWRGVTVEASPALLYRWLCQLKAAPYSYDWIDNFGRTSPRQLISGLDQLAIGQRMMFVFQVVSFEPEREITIMVGKTSWFKFLTGAGAISYQIVPIVAPNGEVQSCRLLGKVAIEYPRGPIGWFNRLWLGWGDLVMMRRQLLNFKKFAERDFKLTLTQLPASPTHLAPAVQSEIGYRAGSDSRR